MQRRGVPTDGHFAGQFRFCSQILEKVWHMDVNTRSSETAGDPGRAGKPDGNTIHLLKADGASATADKKRRAAAVKPAGEVLDCKGERRIPVKIARNMRSRELARSVGEMKAEIVERGTGRRGNQLN